MRKIFPIALALLVLTLLAGGSAVMASSEVDWMGHQWFAQGADLYVSPQNVLYIFPTLSRGNNLAGFAYTNLDTPATGAYDQQITATWWDNGKSKFNPGNGLWAQSNDLLDYQAVSEMPGSAAATFRFGADSKNQKKVRGEGTTTATMTRYANGDMSTELQTPKADVTKSYNGFENWSYSLDVAYLGGYSSRAHSEPLAFTSFDYQYKVVPEPSGMLAMGIGLMGLIGFQTRRRK